jgi:RNA polymerase sigma factor (sigma-70 family)
MERNERHASLVRRVLDGDSAAFETLYADTYKSVFFHAKEILKNNTDVEDAVSEAYLRAYQHLSKLSDPALFQAWVNRIVTNYAMNCLRNDHFRDAPSMDDEFFFYEPAAPDSETPDRVMDRKGTEEIIGKIIKALPEAQRMTVILYYYDEMSVSDIAKTMECSPGTVKSRLNYARRNIELAVREEEKRGIKLYSVSPALLLDAIRRMVDRNVSFLRVPPIAGELAEKLGRAGSSEKFLPRSTSGSKAGVQNTGAAPGAETASAKPTVQATALSAKAKSAMFLKLLSVVAAIGIGMGMYFCYAPDADADETVPEEEVVYDVQIEEPEQKDDEEEEPEIEEPEEEEPEENESEEIPEDIITEKEEENQLNPEADENAESEIAAMPEEKTYYVGDLVDFGRYWQNDQALGSEPITWQVLDIQDDRALLISLYGLTPSLYNTGYSSIWENCYLREWLNSSFVTRAFSSRERLAIQKTVIDNGPEQNSPYFVIGNGPETEDKVFLLSYAEAVKYLPTDDDRICMPTERAATTGALVDQARGSCNWWLRTIANSTSACYISTTGSTDRYQYTTAQDIAVRPCIWVDLNSDIFKYDA